MVDHLERTEPRPIVRGTCVQAEIGQSDMDLFKHNAVGTASSYLPKFDDPNIENGIPAGVGPDKHPMSKLELSRPAVSHPFSSAVDEGRPGIPADCRKHIRKSEHNQAQFAGEAGRKGFWADLFG